MTIEAEQSEQIARQRALEALRNGVPNRDAVRQLGSGQPAVERRFADQLLAARSASATGAQARGMVIEGGFGSGKSHALQHLEHLALEENFVCSRVSVSKETPLNDPAKLFQAAIEAAVLPGVRGHAIQESAQRLDTRGERYAAFYRRIAAETVPIAQVFPATVLIHERGLGDADQTADIMSFWSGGPIKVASVRRWLKDVGAANAFSVAATPAKALALQRFHFAANLFIAAGFDGWVLLLDEVELIGKYGIVGRGRSYGELARWLGFAEAEQYPGLTAVASITDDFVLAILQGKDDRNLVPPRLAVKDTPEAHADARRAETGMLVLDKERVALDPPTPERLRETYDRLHDLHSRAYDWPAPELPAASVPSMIPANARLRSYVRRWIHEWDLRRLYPEASIDTQEQDLQIDYHEDADLERSESDQDN
ncbi:MAG: BREX system ATP-binding domain-containing protein [Dehalococcoidia bacterium]